ncbi:MAG: ArsR/SmtB family transcription factor [Rectinemataceae bacterium]
MDASSKILVIDPAEDKDVVLGLASEVRLDILGLLHKKACNINEIAQVLGIPQSTVAINVAVLEKAGLIHSDIVKAKKGNQKICRSIYEELVIRFDADEKQVSDNLIEVEMPIGLFTSYEVSAPCGLCSPESIIGYLDVPDSFLNPDRMKAGLLWFEQGWVEYKFPNNALYKDKQLRRLEISVELSSEALCTDKNWQSDISLWINMVEIGMWTSPGDYGDKRGKLTPGWWKLEGSQYGLLKNWSVSEEGSFVDGVRISDVSLADLALAEHHSIRVKIGVKEGAAHVGGLNIFGRGFGNYDQAIILRLCFS